MAPCDDCGASLFETRTTAKTSTKWEKCLCPYINLHQHGKVPGNSLEGRYRYKIKKLKGWSVYLESFLCGVNRPSTLAKRFSASLSPFHPCTLAPIATSTTTAFAPSSIPTMDNQLAVRSSDYGSVKTKAIEDAKAMQALVLDNARKSGRNPPKYVLMELIGKGSFGRVYKA